MVVEARARRRPYVGGRHGATVAGTHCAQCAAYEERVMRKAPGEVLPASVVPCAAFVMSDAFRDWAVGEMRKEVAGLVSQAGLDRMAMAKGKPKQP